MKHYIYKDVDSIIFNNLSNIYPTGIYRRSDGIKEHIYDIFELHIDDITICWMCQD